MLTNVCVVKTRTIRVQIRCKLQVRPATFSRLAAKSLRTDYSFSSLVADIAGLKQALFVLVELLRQTGVGALPLEPPQVPDPRPDSTLVEEETRIVQALYERQQRIQDGAGVVAGFLSFAGAGEQQVSGVSGTGRRA